MMLMEPSGNIELDKLLQEVKRTIRENAQFLKSLKQESLSDGSDGNVETVEGADEESFEEL